MSDLRIERIGAPLGARVAGVDVRAVDQDVWKALNALFLEHHVLVFPGQTLTPAEQIAFASFWGELVRHPFAGMSEFPDIIELRNRGKRKDVNQHWHSDMTYNPAPPKLTMLYALQTPALGGDTAFANQMLAYRECSAGLRATLDGLQAEHSAADLARLYGEDPERAPRAEHPVVRTHDETGERALYVCRAFTRRFVGWSREESLGLLEYLYAQAVRPEYQVRQRWRPGDLVIWDNRCVQHFAVHDHGDEPRLIHRLQVAGAVPA